MTSLFFSISRSLHSHNWKAPWVFPTDCSILQTGLVHATTFLKLKGRKASFWLLLVKIKHSASARSESWNTFHFTGNKPSWRTEVGCPAQQRIGYACWKALCGHFFLMVYRLKFWTLHFKHWGLSVCVYIWP